MYHPWFHRCRFQRKCSSLGGKALGRGLLSSPQCSLCSDVAPAVEPSQAPPSKAAALSTLCPLARLHVPSEHTHPYLTLIQTREHIRGERINVRQCSWAIFLVSSSGKLFSFIVISVLRLILIFSGLTSPFLLFYQIIIFISLTFINPKRSFIYIYLSSCKCTINCLQTHFSLNEERIFANLQMCGN